MAFSARPSHDGAGSDVYAWRPGLESVRTLTSDHRSVFAGWVGGLALASGIVVRDGQASDGEPTDLAVRSILIDPETGRSIGDPIADAWRPSVDPDGGYIVFWEGSVAPDPDTAGWRPAEGRLVIARFRLDPVVLVPGIPVSPGRLPAVVPVVTSPVPLADTGVAGWDVLWDGAAGQASVWIVDEDGSSRLVSYALADVPSPDTRDPDIARMRR